MNRGQASDAILDSRLTGPQKLILLGYLKHQSSADAPEAGVSWPGAKRLAEYAGVCEAVAIEHRGSLLTAGVLVVVEHDSGGNKRCRIDFTRFPTVEQAEAMEAARKGKRAHRTRTPLGAADPGASDDATPSAATTPPLGAADPSPRSGRPLPSAPPTPPLVGYGDPPRSGRPNPSVVNPHQGSLRSEPSALNAPQGTGGAEVSATVTDSPPPAEPSGSHADLWSRAADLADPEAWRASEEFQPSTNAYVFDDAEPVGASEQPSDPRQIESPATERNAPNAQIGPVAHHQTSTTTTSQRNAQPSDAHPYRAPEAPPQGSRPSPTHPPGNGEGAPGGATGSQDAPSLFGRTDAAPEAPAPAKAPPRARKPQPPPVDLTSPDDPCPLLLGAKVSIDSLTEDIVAVYRSWWRRQLSPATCRLTTGRLGLIRQALGTYTAEQLVHLVRYAYEAADLGNYARAWRGESGQVPPDLEMLIRGDKVARNVEMSARWSVERVQGAPPAGPLPENVHPFPMPNFNRGGGRDFAACSAVLAQIARDDLNERGMSYGH